MNLRNAGKHHQRGVSLAAITSARQLIACYTPLTQKNDSDDLF